MYTDCLSYLQIPCTVTASVAPVLQYQ